MLELISCPLGIQILPRLIFESADSDLRPHLVHNKHQLSNRISTVNISGFLQTSHANPEFRGSIYIMLQSLPVAVSFGGRMSHNRDFRRATTGYWFKVTCCSHVENTICYTSKWGLPRYNCSLLMGTGGVFRDQKTTGLSGSDRGSDDSTESTSYEVKKSNNLNRIRRICGVRIIENYNIPYFFFGFFSASCSSISMFVVRTRLSFQVSLETWANPIRAKTPDIKLSWPSSNVASRRPATEPCGSTLWKDILYKISTCQ